MTQPEKCLNGLHDSAEGTVAVATFKTGIKEDPSPTQEIARCKYCRCLYQTLEMER